MKAASLALILTTLIASGAESPGDPTIARGRQVAAAAFKELSGNLQQAITKGGFTNAIEFCSEKAIPLTLVVAQKEGVKLTRVSHRPRNPANAASDQERTLIRKYQESATLNPPPEPVVELADDGRRIFYAPIIINNPLCLNCHGDPKQEIATDTLAAISRLYPKDQATGFKLNDVRGLWRIEFPK
jgi:Protein of unknown function (DUF3365)